MFEGQILRSGIGLQIPNSCSIKREEGRIAPSGTPGPRPLQPLAALSRALLGFRDKW